MPVSVLYFCYQYVLLDQFLVTAARVLATTRVCALRVGGAAAATRPRVGAGVAMAGRAWPRTRASAPRGSRGRAADRVSHVTLSHVSPLTTCPQLSVRPRVCTEAGAGGAGGVGAGLATEAASARLRGPGGRSGGARPRW